MTQKNIIIGFCALITVVFLIMIFSFLKGNSIELTDNPFVESNISQPAITNDSPVTGAQNPKVIIFHFGDFANATSTTVASTLNDLLLKYPDDLALVWKNYPNQSLNAQSMKSAIASMCAQKQDVFWEFHNYLIDNTDILSDDIYAQIAEQLDIWQWSYNRCVNNEKTLSLVENDVAEANALSVFASPTLFINNERISGYVSKQDLEQMIVSAIKQYE